MGPEAILLSVAQGLSAGSYRFVCPTCLERVEKPADRKIVALLVSAGVDVSDRPGAHADIDRFRETEPSLFDAQEEPPPDEPHGSGPPFTIDDVIRFHFMLRDDRRLEEFVSGR